MARNLDSELIEDLTAELTEGCDRAAAVIDAWEEGDLAGAVHALELWREGALPVVDEVNDLLGA